jgi:hypothetical protein
MEIEIKKIIKNKSKNIIIASIFKTILKFFISKNLFDGR